MPPFAILQTGVGERRDHRRLDRENETDVPEGSGHLLASGPLVRAQVSCHLLASGP